MPIKTFICTTVNDEVFVVRAEKYIQYYDNTANFYIGEEIITTLDRIDKIQEEIGDE